MAGATILLVRSASRLGFLGAATTFALAAACKATAPASATPDASTAACLNPVTVDPASLPSSPTGCPADEPEAGVVCAPSGLVCHGYGPLSAPITAWCGSTCTWMLAQAPPFEPPDAGSGPVTCPSALATLCCSGGDLCAANWPSQIQCDDQTGSIEGALDIVPDCDGFHAVRNIVDGPGTYLLYSAATEAPIATLSCTGAPCAEFRCVAGPSALPIDAGCLSYWSHYPLYTSGIPCFDAGDAAQELFPCDGGPPPHDAQVASDARGD